MELKSTRSWSPINYFCWLSVGVFIFTTLRFLKATTAAEFYGMSGLNVAAGFGLSALYGSVVVLIVAFALWLVERVGRRLLLLYFAARLFVFVVVVMTWIFALRRFLVDVLRFSVIVPNVIYSATGMAIALLVFIAMRKKILAWLSEALGWVRIVAAVALAIYVLSTVYLLFIEPTYYTARQDALNERDESTRPNVFIIVLDALSAHDMSLYGYSLETDPNLSRLGKQWTVYEDAHSCGTGTLSLMPCILTGRYAYTDEWSRYGALTRSNKSRHWVSLPAVLKSLGYHTVYAQGGGYSSAMYGFHHDFDRVLSVGKDYYLSSDVGYLLSPLYFNFMTYLVPKSVPIFEVPRLELPCWRETVEIEEPLYLHIENYLRVWSQESRGQSIFAYVHLLRPHTPYIPNEFTGRFLPAQEGFLDINSNASFVGRMYTPDEQGDVDKLRLRYNENILKADQELSKLIQAIKEAELYENSLIIVTSDHGTNFTSGYYGYYTDLLAAAEHHVPLLVKYPFQREGRRVSGLVSHVDILTTVLEQVGLDQVEEVSDGQSLSTAGQDANRVVYVRRPNDLRYGAPVYAAISGRMKLVRRKDGLKLFDIKADPSERYDLFDIQDVSKLSAALSTFESRMHAMRAGDDLSNSPPLVQTIE